VSTGIDRERFAAYLRGYFATKRKCETCWAINLCGGYCPWHVSCADGTFAEPQDWWCAELRGWFERGVWLYETLRAQHPDYLSQLGAEVAPRCGKRINPDPKRQPARGEGVVVEVL
jgi:sulfatase maturation enzyme AslB (radical SAM superfamily)